LKKKISKEQQLKLVDTTLIALHKMKEAYETARTAMENNKAMSITTPLIIETQKLMIVVVDDYIKQYQATKESLEAE